MEAKELLSLLHLTQEFTGSNGHHLWTTFAKTENSLNVETMHGLLFALMEILMEMVLEIVSITAHVFPMLIKLILMEMELEMLAHSIPLPPVTPLNDVLLLSLLNHPSETTIVEPAEVQLTTYLPLKPPPMTQAFAHKLLAELSLPLNNAVDCPNLLPNQSTCTHSVITLPLD